MYIEAWGVNIFTRHWMWFKNIKTILQLQLKEYQDSIQNNKVKQTRAVEQKIHLYKLKQQKNTIKWVEIPDVSEIALDEITTINRIT